MGQQEQDRQGDAQAGAAWHSDGERLRRAVWSLATRQVARNQPFTISCQAFAPRAGDLVLARLDATGQPRDLQMQGGRRRTLILGDEVVAVYGDCCVPGEFQAVVPRTIGPCHLVTSGGVAGKMTASHGRKPALITPIGYLLHVNGERATVADAARELLAEPAPPARITVVLVGTGAKSGVGSAAAFLARGISRAGLRVCYARVSSSAADLDTWLLHDAGANPVLDFSDMGRVSTAGLCPAELERIFNSLCGHLARSGADAALIEIGDGLLQPETAKLLDSQALRSVADGVLLAASDAMGAAAGVSWLARRGLPVTGLCGTMTAAPLQGTEATAATGVLSYRHEDLLRVPVVRAILGTLRKQSKIIGQDDARTGIAREDTDRASA
jgi:hypothetical protein